MSTLKAALPAIRPSVNPTKIYNLNHIVTAASRNHTDVLEFLICLPSINLFVRNLQNETVYDIVAERGDLASCELIEQFERVHWAEAHPNGGLSFLGTPADFCP